MKVRDLIRYLLLAGGALAVLVVLTLSMLSPDDGAGTLAATGNDDPEAIAQRQVQQNVSVIESIFGSAGEEATIYELENNFIEDEPHPDNPGNPFSGKQYSDREMAAFEELRETFPNNRMIPRRMTKEEAAAYEAAEQELAKKHYVERRVKILTGGLNKAEVDEYFAYRTRFTLDKIELFRYALDNISPDAPDARRKRLERLLNDNERKIDRVLSQKTAAYQKNGVEFQPGDVYLEDPAKAAAN